MDSSIGIGSAQAGSRHRLLTADWIGIAMVAIGLVVGNLG